jgi:hypothetical protein
MWYSSSLQKQDTLGQEQINLFLCPPLPPVAAAFSAAAEPLAPILQHRQRHQQIQLPLNFLE